MSHEVSPLSRPSTRCCVVLREGSIYEAVKLLFLLQMINILLIVNVLTWRQFAGEERSRDATRE
jgi:hypothetical protein